MELKSFRTFIGINESEDEEIRFTGKIDKKESEEDMEPRLFDEDHGRRMELLKLFKELEEKIHKANPHNQEEFDEIKSEITTKKEEIMSHPDFELLKNEGLPWQDTRLYLEDVMGDIKKAVLILAERAQKKGLS